MAKINNLSISYPDFVLNTTIEPEQFDTNNLEIVTKINTLLDRLHSNVVGESGASEVTVSPVGARAYTNLQDALATIDSILINSIENITANDIDIAKNALDIVNNNIATLAKFATLDGNMINFDIRQGMHETVVSNQIVTGDNTLNGRITDETDLLRGDLASNDTFYKQMLTNLQGQFQSIIDLGGNPSVEVVQARNLFANLKARLDSMDARTVIQATIPTVGTAVENVLYFVYDGAV